MKDAADEDIFRGDEDEGPVCCVCGNTLESWEEDVRYGSRMCSYHAHQVDKDEKEAQKPATARNVMKRNYRAPPKLKAV